MAAAGLVPLGTGAGGGAAALDGALPASPAIGPGGGPREDAGGWGALPPGISAEVRSALAAAPAKTVAVIVHLVDPLAPREPREGGGAPSSPRRRPGESGPRPDAAGVVARRKAAFGRSRAGVMAALDAAVERGSAAGVTPLWIVNAVAVQAEGRLVAELAARRDVWAVTADHRFPAPGAGGGLAGPTRVETRGPRSMPGPQGAEVGPAWNLEAIHAPDVWTRLGFDGAGVTVALLDTGADYYHPALTTRYRGYRGRVDPDNAGNWWCPVEMCGQGQRYPVDDGGHGTHVLGTILGQGTGVAPGATWIAAMVCDAEECQDRFILAALQWLIDTGTPRPRAAAVNMSLEKRGPTDWVMKKAIDTVVDAGVVAVVAAGNRGQVFSPGIFTTTITVGALNDEGDVPVWSGRGVSPWFEHKPDVVAPGVGVVSTLPGGGVGPKTGTSMATPHVTGASALLLSARPDLGPEEVKRILRETSDRDFTTVPDDAQGWGLVNAYGAVASVLDVGTLEGKVASTTGGPPGWGAAVAVDRPDGTPVTGTRTDADGSFRLAVMPGDYLVTAAAFGYVTVTKAAAVETGTVTRLDFSLPPRGDGGWINGMVTEAGSGAPLAGRIVVEGTPVTGTLVDGFYSLTGVPPGTYRLRAESPGHKVGRATASLDPGATARADFALAPAPRLLLVDGDAWRFSGAIAYYEASLDRLEYLYDTWRVLDPAPGNAPTAEDLAPYDLVVWSHDISSPGYVGAGGAIDAYLRGGGKLLVAGQDVACNDSGSSPCARPEARQPYLRDRLLADYVADAAGGSVIRGRSGTPLEGITATLNGGTSLDNQFAPDVLAAADPLRGAVIIEYEGGGGAAILAEACLGYRAALLGFGLEGIAEASARDAILEALIAALTVEAPDRLVAGATPSRLIAPAGSTADYTVTLFSTAAVPVQVTAAVSAAWPVELFEAGFQSKLTAPLTAGSCRGVPFGVRVSVPENMPRAVSDTALVTVTASGSGATATQDLNTRTPAAILVVDGDSFYQSEATYLDALDGLPVTYDVWEIVAPDARQPRRPPDAAYLALHPVVIWFTGYNPFPTGQLGDDNELMLAGYLEAGGRLLFSSEDHLDYRGASPFRGHSLFWRDFLGAAGYRANVGVRRLRGVADSIFAGVADCALRPSGSSRDEYFGDQLFPAPRAQAALVGDKGQIVATQYASGTFKSSFLSFDAGKLAPGCAGQIIGRALDWFSPLYPSRLRADRPTYASGDTVRLEAELGNDGPGDIAGVIASWELPEGATPADIPPGWSWKPTTGTLEWRGDLGRHIRRTAGVDLILDADLPPATRQTSRLVVVDPDGLAVERVASWRVNVADLSTSAKTVTLPEGVTALEKGDVARFTVAVRNRGTVAVPSFRVTDTLPAGLRLVDRSLTRPAGVRLVVREPRRLVWESSVAPGGEVSVSYDAQVMTRVGGRMRNTAVVSTGEGEPMEMSASVFVAPNLLLPWLAQRAERPRR